MITQTDDHTHTVLSGLDDLLPRLEAVHADLAPADPAAGDARGATEVARRLIGWGHEVTTGVGGTGVVGMLPNGDGPTVMLRAELDGPFGHDLHTTCLLGAARLLARALPSWSGTLLTVFQPAAASGTGAQAMIDDGLFARFPSPSVILAQHVTAHPAGFVLHRAGTVLAARDSLRIRFHDQEGPGPGDAKPTDPVVELDVRAFSESSRTRFLDALERIAQAEAAGAARGPDVERRASFPLTVNDPAASARVAAALARHLGPDRVLAADPSPVGDDFARYGAAAPAPACYWFLGCLDPSRFTGTREPRQPAGVLPSPCPPSSAPALRPTLATGVRALVAAAMAWLEAPG